jgi:hypothetical protein
MGKQKMMGFEFDALKGKARDQPNNQWTIEIPAIPRVTIIAKK